MLTNRAQILFILIVTLSVTGCAIQSPTQAPFQAFLDVTQQVDQSTNSVLEYDYQQEKQAFRTQLSQATAFDATALFLEPDLLDPFELSYPGQTPLFQTIAEHRRKARTANQLLTQYAALLVTLTSADTGSFDIAREAESLNEQAITFLGTDGSALFSTLFATAAKAYLENKRKNDLVELLAQGQNIVDRLSGLGQKTAELSAQGVKKNYDLAFSQQARQIAPGTAAGSSDIDGLFAINQRTIEQLRLLRELHQTYTSLPANHSLLISAVQSNQDVSFYALINQASSLNNLYSQLQRQNTNSQ